MRMASAWEYLERLTRRPHRGTGTAGEAAAAAEMKQWLDDLGYTVEVQPFKAPQDTLYRGPAVVMFCFALALLWRVPWLGLACCALLFVPLSGELTGSLRLDLDLLLSKVSSQNLVARRPPVGSAPGRTLVVSAHYDTQRATHLFHPRFVPWIPVYFNLAYAGLGLTPVVLLLQWALPGAGWAWTPGLGLSAFLALNALFLRICDMTGSFINGANDNGTGAALVLALADRFAHTPLPGTEVIFLLTGAEEVGTRGMKHFMRTARLDPDTTRFINLDNLGGGQIHYLAGEGMVKVQAYSPELIALAEQLGAEHGGCIRRKANLLLPTDGLIPTAAGYQAISFLAFNEDGSLPNYHWYTDTLERVDRDLLAFAEAFFAEYLLRAAQGADTVLAHHAG